ncbi:hypothetical protein [Saccharopolyspora shandongensis]|uniref:hypothetical protein n=1 Tax=Saccharopolyspora shandongensis TaxID=418495 RepID=UPI0033C97E8B
MVVRTLHQVGLRSTHLQMLSLGSVLLCLGLWVRAKTVDEEQRGNAERRALFTGLWPPTLWLIGVSLHELERRRDARSTAPRH